ncbi:ATP-citrate synthase alpha chain protein 3 [Capsicum baccatum]|uniref:ATP-citrate synthase alpha chain protein 3 n=1 Tax=Capsicum baccatum TaxID=33114 RepID=A0A2G2WPS8_CAPBA|nr:ATP-citrate synthase alpha chain protein 3 [Capsicum baccatum]
MALINKAGCKTKNIVWEAWKEWLGSFEFGSTWFVKIQLGVEVEMGGCKAPITTFIVEPFVPHDQEYYLSIVSERLGCTISFSECGGIEIEESWDKHEMQVPREGRQYEICTEYVKL